MPKPRGYRDRIGPWLAKKAMMAAMEVPEEEIVVLDVGAHKGDITAMYMRMWPKAEYHLFEPRAEAVEVLRERFKDDECVYIHPVAIGATADVVAQLHVGGHNGEMSSLLPRPAKDRRYYRHELEPGPQVTMETLDSIVRALDLKNVHLIKMDIQGGEGAAIEGAAKYVLRYKRPLFLYLEVFFVPMYERSWHFHEISARLGKMGYSLFDLYGLGRSPVSRQLKYGDALFIHKSVRKQVIDQYPEEWLPKSLAHAMGMAK
jgi:FkbM family methyltransferase